MSVNPLVVEAWRGLATYGRAQRAYAGYLVVQAAVLVLWWPKSPIAQALASHARPDPLLAVVIALGVTVAYHAMRAGAEEILLEGQFPLREWVAAGLALPRVVAGYVAGQLLQSLHAIALSAPLVLAAFSVGGGSWPALGGCVIGTVALALLHRLAAACLYLRMGHHAGETFMLLRVVFAAAYLIPAYAFEPASHLVLSYRLLGDGAAAGGPALAPVARFTGIHAAASAVLLWVLYHQLARYRASLRVAPAGAPAHRST